METKQWLFQIARFYKARLLCEEINPITHYNKLSENVSKINSKSLWWGEKMLIIYKFIILYNLV